MVPSPLQPTHTTIPTPTSTSTSTPTLIPTPASTLVSLPPRRSSSPLFNLLKRSPSSSTASSSASTPASTLGQGQGQVAIPTLAQLEEMVDGDQVKERDPKENKENKESKETRTMSMSEGSFIDREWEEVDWERVKTLPMVCLIPPEEEEMGPVTLYPLLPPLPPSHPRPTSIASTSSGTASAAGSASGRDSRPGSVWGTMANGFILPPPVFSRSPSPSPGRQGFTRGSVIMPKKRSEVVASRARQLAREMVEGPTPPRTSSLSNDISHAISVRDTNTDFPGSSNFTKLTIDTEPKHAPEPLLKHGQEMESSLEVQVDDIEPKVSVSYLATAADALVVLEDRMPPLSVEVIDTDTDPEEAIAESEDSVIVDQETCEDESKDEQSLGQSSDTDLGTVVSVDTSSRSTAVGAAEFQNASGNEEVHPQVELHRVEVVLDDAITNPVFDPAVPTLRYRTPSPPPIATSIDEPSAPLSSIPTPMPELPASGPLRARRPTMLHAFSDPNTETSPVLMPRKVSSDSTKSRDREKKRRRTFSLTSLLAPKSKSADSPAPPVPSIPIAALPPVPTITSNKAKALTERVPGGPPTPSASASGVKVRKQKSLKQILFPTSDSPPPPLPTRPEALRGFSGDTIPTLNPPISINDRTVPVPVSAADKREGSRSRKISGQSTLSVLDSNQTPLDIDIDDLVPSPLSSPITGPQIRHFDPSPITGSTSTSSRVGTRFSLSNLSGAFKRMASHSLAQSQKDAPPVPSLPPVKAVSAGRAVPLLPSSFASVQPTPETVTESIQPRYRGTEQLRRRDFNRAKDDADEDDDDDDDDDDAGEDGQTRTRTTSGFSATSLASNGSPTCRNLTSVSPRTQRNPSASPALQQYMQVGPSSGVRVERCAHRRYQSVEATVFLGTVSSMDSIPIIQVHGYGHEVLPSTSEESSSLPTERTHGGRLHRDGSADSVISGASQSGSSTRDSGGASLPDLETLTTPPIRSSGMSMDDIRRHMPITEPTTIMLDTSYSDKGYSGSSSSLPTLRTAIIGDENKVNGVDHQQQRPSISSMIETSTHPYPYPQAEPDVGLYERDSNRPTPHIRMEMPVPTIKIKNRPFSPDAIRRLISLKRSRQNGVPKRHWGADRTASEPTIHTNGSGIASESGSGSGENRQGVADGGGGLEASGQLKSLHFDDLGLDFDDLDWEQWGVGSVQSQIQKPQAVDSVNGNESGSRRGNFI